jgi:hypothetical protein
LWFEVSTGYFTRPYLKKTHHKKGLVKWLKVQIPVPQKQKQEWDTSQRNFTYILDYFS